MPGPTGQFISRKTFLGEPGYHDTSIEQFRIGYQLDHRLNDVFSFQQNLAYQSIRINLREVQSLANPNTTTTSRVMANQVFNIDMYQVDNKLKADFDDRAVPSSCAVRYRLFRGPELSRHRQ